MRFAGLFFSSNCQIQDYNIVKWQSQVFLTLPLNILCRFTIDVLQKIKKYTVTSICVIVEVLTKTHAKEETVYEYYNTNYEV